jgi:hypothetical protein
MWQGVAAGSTSPQLKVVSAAHGCVCCGVYMWRGVVMVVAGGGGRQHLAKARGGEWRARRRALYRSICGVCTQQGVAAGSTSPQLKVVCGAHGRLGCVQRLPSASSARSGRPWHQEQSAVIRSAVISNSPL